MKTHPRITNRATRRHLHNRVVAGGFWLLYQVAWWGLRLVSYGCFGAALWYAIKLLWRYCATL